MTAERRLDVALRALWDEAASAKSEAEDHALVDACREAAETASPLLADRRRLETALGRGFPVAA